MSEKKIRLTNLSLPTEGRVLIKAAKIYDAVQPFVTLGQEAGLNRFIASCFSSPGRLKVIDVGCGTGQLANLIAEGNRDITITGIDASLPMIQVASKKRAIPERCSFIQALGEDIPFEDSSFDAAVSALFFHHVKKSLKLKCMQEIHRILKPGGKLIIADMDRPYNPAGALLSYGAWILLRQPEIKENIDGIIGPLLREAGYINIKKINRFSGYINVTEAFKPESK